MHTKMVKILIVCATDKYLQNRENGHKCSASRVYARIGLYEYEEVLKTVLCNLKFEI